MRWQGEFVVIPPERAPKHLLPPPGNIAQHWVASSERIRGELAYREPVPLEEAIRRSQVLFLADAEDEFQLVDTTGSWVHVQISGISRGWIERDKINLPGESAQKTPSAAASNPAPDQVKPEAFRPTREETGTFPGNWAELRGKTVRIIWVDTPANDSSPQETRLSFAKALFRKKFPELSQTAPSLAGVVIVFDAEDGGMAAATMAALQQWNAGHL